VTASGAVGVFVGETFDTPEEQGTVGGAKSCRAPACDCVDLGDIIGDFELPRACEITVHATFSGRNVAGSGPLKKDADVASATITAELSGGFSLPLDDAICGGDPCGTGTADAAGTTTFTVPVIGDSPELQVRAEWTVSMDDDVHYYTGTVHVAGCGRDQESLDADVEVETDHASLGDVKGFIDSLGAGPSVSDPSPLPSVPEFEAPRAPSCACRQGPSRSTLPAPSLAACLGLLGLWVARRRRKNQRF
jgi:hypothetical protein